MREPRGNSDSDDVSSAENETTAAVPEAESWAEEASDKNSVEKAKVSSEVVVQLMRSNKPFSAKVSENDDPSPKMAVASTSIL